MVKVDTVYQTVLALANKEQRGYITPQEFNLFARLAQMDIFEQYFYDLNQFKRVPQNDKKYSNPVDIINEKLDYFRTRATLDSGSDNNLSTYNLPNNHYRTTTVWRRIHSVGAQVSGARTCERVYHGDYRAIIDSPLTRPTQERPIYAVYQSGDSSRIIINPAATMDPGVELFYIKKPASPSWGYVIVGGSAMYNPDGGTQDFELHPSEEQNLVIKIAKLAGIAIKDAGLAQAASQEEVKNYTQEKA
jgi:hypothetical protein